MSSTQSDGQRLQFDSKQRQELGIYIYLLIDPKDGSPFYIGKAGGTGAGNTRIQDHFAEAETWLRTNGTTGSQQPNPKVKTILEIWERGQKVDWLVVRRKIPSVNEAFRLEGALMDVLGMFGGTKMHNVQSGHHRSEEGILGREAVLALGASPFDPTTLPPEARDRNIFLFNIGRGLKALNPTDDEIYEATRKAWKLAPKYRAFVGSYAVGLVDGVSFGAYAIDLWEPLEDRWGFVRGQISAEAEAALLHKDFRIVLADVANWRFGGFGAFTVSESGKRTIARGARRM